MSKAFMCNICKQYKDGEVPYQIKVLYRLGDPRDQETEKYLDACDECGKKLWNMVD